MKLTRLRPRPDWRREVEAAGLSYHTPDDIPYWIDDRAIALSSAQAEGLRRASDEVYGLLMRAAQHVVHENLFAALGLPDHAAPFVRASWARRDPALFGRFDFAWDGHGSPKLIEFNGDTPGGLIEASTVQTSWLTRYRDQLPGDAVQYNTLASALEREWGAYPARGPVHFAHLRDWDEDRLTTEFVRDRARAAGLDCELIHIEDLGHDGRHFFDLKDRPVRHLFKFYPWDDAWSDTFGEALLAHSGVIEPAWKMIVQSKGLLPILWRLFPDHPNLLPASPNREHLGPRVVRKPVLSRKGANISIEIDERTHQTAGAYAEQPFIYQEYAPLPDLGHGSVLTGAWVINGRACGISFREGDGLITDDAARALPHFIAD